MAACNPTHNPIIVLPYLSWVLGGISYTFDLRGPCKSPQTIRDMHKTTKFLFEYLIVKFVASMMAQ